MEATAKKQKNIAILIVVASLGYFVDIYDLILFNIIKKESLNSLSIDFLTNETVLFRWQMAGMLLGGLFWGIYGDKKGRVSVLFGSILIYSIANIANAFVTTLEAYKVWRFIAGLGLAGELGAAITLVSELMPIKKRGIGTMIIVTFGALGAVVAFFVSNKGEWLGSIIQELTGKPVANWQVAYIVGGLLGLVLLVLRAGTFESDMFKKLETDDGVKRGNFFQLFSSKNTFLKYLACILIGLPVWFVVGILIALAHRFLPVITGSEAIMEQVATKELILWSYVGLSAGDFLSGLLSQWMQSRKKVILIYLVSIIIIMSLYLYGPVGSANYYRVLSLLLGISTGYWALFVTNASEQFGTNIRSTVAATVPNFVRGGVLLITWSYEYFETALKSSIHSAMLVGIICVAVAIWGTLRVEESFHKDLNYYE
ncbi:MAG: MFS transporter [Bacteroidia bacterium]